MHLTALPDFVRSSADYRATLQKLQNASIHHKWQVIGAARPYLLAALARDWHAPIIYITGRGKRAYNIAEQLPVWLGADNPRQILRFAEPTPMFYDHLPWDREVIAERMGVLDALMLSDHKTDHLSNADAPIIVTSARALMQTTIPPRLFRQSTQTLKKGDITTPDALLHTWLSLGYEPTTMVTQAGQFSRRGGILDVYPLSSDLPVRIEFFGDEIDTLRTFSPDSQRTKASIDQVRIIPAREAMPTLMPRATRHLTDWFATHADDEVSSWQQDSDALEQGTAFNFLEYYLPYISPNPVSLLDYATTETLIIVEDSEDLDAVMQDLIEDADANRMNNLKTNQLPDDYPVPFVDKDLLTADLAQRTVLEFTRQSDAGARIFKPGGRWGGQLRPFLNDMREMMMRGARVVIVSQQIERLEQLWYDQDSSEYIPKVDHVSDIPDAGQLLLVNGTLGEGWTLETDGNALHILTDAEIFNWSRPEPRRRKRSDTGGKRKLPEADYADWNEGDFVVHIDFGIGQFRGLRTHTVEGNEREYLMIEYGGTDTLFVPIHQADRLTRYVGANERPPTLNKLGKPIEWVRTREKARKAAEEEAKELLEIYAKRAYSVGFAYQPDTPWQSELEASFPYVETEDQLHALTEIKRDMQQSMPMDRLVCGDVGYGKTEVALRATFKAVMDNKQVAILVPTTVLADQHYQTFSRRMAPFPIKVALLSRFRTKTEQAKAVDELADGTIDIIIGTHRLLSNDVAFKNLGLVIIDEEQRFGVKHKEHFKKFRANVDVLTLTATPIPRTLYMSLSGVRDISMIQTPPEERLPVITHVSSFDEKLARQAILREIDRGGQVFIIHNRVRTIQTVREKFERIVPEATIIVGHGQMGGRELEAVISDFGSGKYDILLATSIIENGIDMPNVNTLIVDRADWFGMSQLYQIRGRVGRGAQQAYAYFFHAGGKLTEEAKQRLETLAEHTDLGAGFQVSVRDLEIRGAGDILSTKQTGHVVQVGLQLYSQLLQQAVKRQKGDIDSDDIALDPTDKERVIIDLPIPAYIPNDWIPEMALRLQLYRRISALKNVTDIDAISAEMRDRFGRLPRAVEGLLFQIHVKLLATAINATAIVKPRERILIKLPWLTAIDRDELDDTLGEDVDVTRVAVEVSIHDVDDIWRLRLLEILESLEEYAPQTEDLMGEN